MYISSKNKNPLIKFEQEQTKNQKTQKILSLKKWRKCMIDVNKLKKEGYLGLTYTWGQKPLKIWGGKQQKFLDGIDRERKRQKGEKTIWKNEEHVLRKSLLFFFPFESRSIEYQSGTNQAKHKVFFKIT